MLIVTSIAGAYGLMVAGLLLLGTWPVLWAVIEGRGRRPSHTFLDYALTYLLTSVVLAFTLGQIGGPQQGRPNFVDQLGQSNGPLVAFALAGGVSLAVGDVCMMFSVALLGLAVGPAAINALSIIVGTTLNYVLDGGLNDAAILFPGLACAAVATAFGALAHLRSQKDKAATKQASLNSTPDSSWAHGQKTIPPCGTEAGSYPDSTYGALVGPSTDTERGMNTMGGVHDQGAAMDESEGVSTNDLVLQASSPCAQSMAQGNLPPSGGVMPALAVSNASLRCAPTTAVLIGESPLSMGIRSVDDRALRSEQALGIPDLGTASKHLSAGASVSKPDDVRNAVREAGERGDGVSSDGGGSNGGHVGVDVYADVDGDAVEGGSGGRARGVVLADTGSRYLGLIVAGGGGLVYAFFTPAFNVATNDNFGLLAPGVAPLSIYATDFYFAIGFTSISVVVNIVFLYRPPLGTAASSTIEYLSDNDGRLLSILAGVLACLGDMTQFLAGQAVGYAAASVVQAYPLVGTIIGIAFFREFRGVSRTARLLLIAQVGFYIAAIALLAASAKSRAS